MRSIKQSNRQGEKKNNLRLKGKVRLRTMKIKYLSLRIEESLYEEFISVCYRMGIQYTTAINLFINKCVELDNLPFSLSETIQSFLKIIENEKMKRLSIRVQEEHYQRFTEICDRIGIRKSRVVRIFILRCIDKGGLPFDVN